MNALPPPGFQGSVRSAVHACLGPDFGADLGYLGAEGDQDRELVVTLCNEAVAFSWTLSRDLPAGHVGQRARTAATLMLELAFPEMRAGLRHRLGLICEIVATGARPL